MNTVIRFEKMINTLQLDQFIFEVREPSVAYRKHHNRLFELFICREGEVISTVHNESMTLRARDAVFIKPGVKHQFRNESGKPYSFFQLHFDIDDNGLRQLLSNAPCRYIRRDQEQGTRLTALLVNIESMLPHPAAEEGEGDSSPVTVQLELSNKLTLQAYVLLIIAQITMLPAADPVRDKPPLRKDSTTYTVDTAHQIEEQLNMLLFSDVSIAHIAKKLNISASQCSKIFRQVYGTSPRHYLSQLKLNKAKELLVKTDMPILVISSQLGFSSINHFSRQFRRWTGISPSHFRPKHTL